MNLLRIGVLMGGKSLEKEVSFNSGRTICDHLDTTQYIAIPIFQTSSQLYLLPWHFLHRGKTTDFEHRLAHEAIRIMWDDLKNHIDFLYIAQHGRYAEDGTLQGFLEILGIHYFGSGILASALRADKSVHKILLNNVGIATPTSITIEPDEIEHFGQHKQSIFARLTEKNITDPYLIKPCNEGSSLGVSVSTITDLEQALIKASCIEPGKRKRVLIEEKIIGMEFTCIVLTNSVTGKFFALPPTESIADPAIGFFDYEQKYMPGRGIKRTPARCNDDIIARIQQTCICVMQTLGFTTMGRIDGFVQNDGTIIIIDPNTFSGMAPSSYIINQAAEIDMSPSQLINHILTTELVRNTALQQSIIEKEEMKNQIIPTAKIRVAILVGGASNEKETSLDSGRNVFYKLSPHKYLPLAIFVSDQLELYKLTQSQLVRNSTKEIIELLDESQKIKWNDLPTIADFVFNGLHGGQGENGSVQGALEILGLPYNGSSVLASALCMNKYKTNELLALNGFDVPRNVFITKAMYNKPELDNALHANNFTFPLIVKPHDDGCSVMVQKVDNEQELIVAIAQVLEQKDAVLIEECIIGMELTVGVIGNNNPRALPPSQAISAHGILSIEEKFLPGAGENQTPAPLPQTALSFVQKTMENVYKTIQCKGYVRIDCFYQTAQESSTGNERVVILEINTLPGLTPATCLFHQAAEIGLKPMDFIDMIITLGFEEHAHAIEGEQDHIIKQQELS